MRKNEIVIVDMKKKNEWLLTLLVLVFLACAVVVIGMASQENEAEKGNPFEREYNIDSLRQVHKELMQ